MRPASTTELLSRVSPSIRRFASASAFVTLAVSAVSLVGCPSSGAGGGVGAEPHWPAASRITPKPLPPTVTWQGVYFINTPGSRGTMHVFNGSDDKVYGCWLAEDKHAKATFVGRAKENLAMFDWTQRRIGFAGAPERVTAYLVLTPDPETGRDKVEGEYGADVSDDSGSRWEGVRQKNQTPRSDGCKLDEGDTTPSETKPLN